MRPETLTTAKPLHSPPSRNPTANKPTSQSPAPVKLCRPKPLFRPSLLNKTHHHNHNHRHLTPVIFIFTPSLPLTTTPSLYFETITLFKSRSRNIF
ncbi:hypothetical protein Hanom_Chr07g00633921 [Helianthus anomalus]